MKRERIGWAAFLLCVLIGAPGTAWALTDEEIFRDFRFNFVNPGARSLGMGGAFIAAADDATAAQANPAALHYVTRQELFLEYRSVQPEKQVFSASQGDPNNPNPLFLNLQSVSNRENTNFPSFASYAVPFNLGSRRGRFAVSRQVVLNVDNKLQNGPSETTFLDFSTSDFTVWPNPGNTGCGPAGPQQYKVCNEVDGTLATELVHYNLGFSYSFLDDFSVGVTATYATLDMNSEVTNTTRDPRGFVFSVNPRLVTGGIFSPIQTRTRIDDKDSALAYTIGAHWHPDRVFPGGYSPLRFGLVYRKGAELQVEESKSNFDPTLGQYLPDPTTPTFKNTLREPDRYGFGVSYSPGQHWTFALDTERIKYSQLLKDYREGVNFFTSTTIGSASADLVFTDLTFDVDDATVFHGGVEFLSRRGGWTYAVRAGYYNAPDNRIRLTDIQTQTGSAEVQASYLNAFRGGDKTDHFTGGVSLNTPAGFQVQFAGDFANTGNEYLVSAIYRLGKVR